MRDGTQTLIGRFEVGDDLCTVYLRERSDTFAIDVVIATTWERPGYAGGELDAWLLSRGSAQLVLIRRPESGVLPKVGSRGATISGSFEFSKPTTSDGRPVKLDLVAAVVFVKGNLRLFELEARSDEG